LQFLHLIRLKNAELFYFGLICLFLSLVFIVLSRVQDIQVAGTNAWIKPFKFSFSTFLYAWAMACYCSYLPSFNLSLFNWGIIVLLGFEIVYIAIQAGRGQLSHFNLSSSFYSIMYSLMALAASAATLLTAWVAVMFFRESFPDLPDYYVWSIRLALIIFVIFSFEGFVMGSALKHTIGGPDGGPGLPILNWSTRFGDPRVAHFIGMHALQVLPLLSFYLLKNKWLTFLMAALYVALAFFTLVQALKGKPFIAGRSILKATENKI
jgi:hypothetical protein